MRRQYASLVEIVPGPSLIRLGSRYGGWAIEESPALYSSTIVSCGLGEDASFDVEFASKFNATVVIVDPTPRAKIHFESMMGRVGQRATTGYTSGGAQPIEAYDLEKLSSSSFVFVSKAIWCDSGSMRFYAPRDPRHVSHSLVNLQSRSSNGGAFIMVECISIDDLLRDLKISSLPVLKLDIEGAAGTVLHDMLKRNIRPQQILVEFDELALGIRSAKTRFIETIHLMQEAGYTARYFDGVANFLFAL